MYFVENELKIVEERKECPELFNRECNELSALPKLYWNNKFQKNHLIELITALVSAEAIVDTSNRPIEFHVLANIVLSRLNLKVSSARNMKDKLLRRKDKLTTFLDILREHIIQKAQKKENRKS